MWVSICAPSFVHVVYCNLALRVIALVERGTSPNCIPYPARFAHCLYVCHMLLVVYIRACMGHARVELLIQEIIELTHVRYYYCSGPEPAGPDRLLKLKCVAPV